MVNRTRRQVVASAGALSVVALAGCSDDDDDEVVDLTGEDRVDVVVGAGPNGLEFDPEDIRIDAGTLVHWEWTGEGGQHNVVDIDGAFESELTAEEGYTFEHTFEDAGTYEYVCTPHQTQGMRGTVEVVE